MVPFCDVVRRAAAAMESVDDPEWPIHRRHHRDQCQVRDVGTGDPDDPPPSPPRTAGRRVRPPRGSRVGFNFAILFPNSDGFTERRTGLIRIWLAGVEDNCRLEDAHDAMLEVLWAAMAQHQVSVCGSFAIGWEVPVVVVPCPPVLDTAPRVKQEPDTEAALSSSTGTAGMVEAESAAGRASLPRARPPAKRRRRLRIKSGGPSTAPGITGTSPELAASGGPAGSTAAASSASSGAAASFSAASPPGSADSAVVESSVVRASSPIRRRGGDGCPCSGNCGSKRCKRRQNSRGGECGQTSGVSTTVFCVDCRCMAHGCGLMRYQPGHDARWCRSHGKSRMHDNRFQYACGAGVRSFRPSWPPVIRFIAKFGCVLRHLLPLDAVRMLEFVHDLVTTIEQPTILPADALVAIFFAHGLKWPAAVGYFRDNLTGQARPWTASHFEEAIRHSITMSDGERRRNIFRGMNSSKRMHATTGLAVNGVNWGALAAHSAVSAAGPEGDTRTLVSLGVAGTLYEVRRTPELNATIEHIMDAAAMFVNGVAGSSAMPRDAAEVINVLEELSLFYRRARGNRIGKSLATQGYGCKHFTRIFLMAFQRVNPGVCDMATYKDLAEFIPDEGKHVPESVAELTCGELANLFDVGVGELPMWACLAGTADELIAKLLVKGDVSQVVTWQRDQGLLDCDGEEWPMTVPDTLENWLQL